MLFLPRNIKIMDFNLKCGIEKLFDKFERLVRSVICWICAYFGVFI